MESNLLKNKKNKNSGVAGNTKALKWVVESVM